MSLNVRFAAGIIIDDSSFTISFKAFSHRHDNVTPIDISSTGAVGDKILEAGPLKLAMTEGSKSGQARGHSALAMFATNWHNCVAIAPSHSPISRSVVARMLGRSASGTSAPPPPLDVQWRLTQFLTQITAIKSIFPSTDGIPRLLETISCRNTAQRSR